MPSREMADDRGTSPVSYTHLDVYKRQDLKTGADGKVTINWPEPGMYWLNVTTPTTRNEGGPADGPPAGPPQRRASYVSTLEVLAP